MGHHDIPRLDASNLGGITTLMNKNMVRADIDLKHAENDVMGRKQKEHRPVDVDPIKLYDMEMTKIAEEIGIDLQDDSRGGGTHKHSASKSYDVERGPSISLPSRHDRDKKRSRPSSIRSIDSIRSRGSRGGSGGGSQWSGSGSEYSYDSEYDSDYSGSGSAISSGYGSGSSRRSGGSDGAFPSISRPSFGQQGPGSASSGGGRRRSHHNNITNEQERRSQIHSVINNIRHETKTTYGIEHERIQDMKIVKLEEIDSIKAQLEEEGIPVSTAGSPTINSSLEEIEATLRILTLKTDRARYSTFAEEMILGVAEAFEAVFDGTRKIPILGIAPSYVGYSSTVAVKLARCRSSTASIVGGIIEKHSISPSWRLAMELLPGFLLYPRVASKAQNKSSLHSEFVGRAMNDIRDADREKNFQDLHDI
jgi:hypothetical protein